MTNPTSFAVVILLLSIACQLASTGVVVAFVPTVSNHRLPITLQSTVLPIPSATATTPKEDLISSNVLTIPSKEELAKVQPELGYDDLNYVQSMNSPPKPGTIMKMLPVETWDIDTKTSLMYFGIDFVAVAATMGFLNEVVTSDIYNASPLHMQAMMVVPLQILTGFAMWCMWCIGHDAGHSTVSKSKSVNRIVGEIAHSMICLTPFLPWAKSHKKHHLGHNHLTRDYSHQWFIREEQDTLHPLIKFSYWTRNLQLPILYLVYLLFGVPDGGHVIFYGRMWEGESNKEKLNGLVSVAVSVATAAWLWSSMGTANFAVVCMAPWCVMSFWLFMVTYLQHHSEDGKLYTDDTFTFEKGAFETVDRNYGKWVNRMSHHMMDGHVVHHLFFEKVPHYRLEAATKALKDGLESNGQSHLYKSIETPNFTQEILKQFNENWFFINENQVMRK